MPDNSLIVPTVLTTGSLYFASVKPEGTAQDVIDSLVALDEVNSDILGDLEEAGWALQKVREEESGRTWQEHELEAIGDDIVASSTPVAPLLNTTPPSSTRLSIGRYFSAFPLTSHLHKPALRLVSLHPLLSFTVTFLRVPQIHDGYEWCLFISRRTTVEAAVESVVNELGLSKSLPLLGGSTFEYVLEEVWTEGSVEESSRLPASSLVSSVIETPFASNPFHSSARRSIRFCIPDEWFRRSKSRHVTSTSHSQSESTNKLLADLDAADCEGSSDGEDTAKQQKVQTLLPHNERRDSADWRSSLSQSRLSSLFDGWPNNPPSMSPNPTSAVFSHERVNVSEPKLVENHTGRSGASIGYEENEMEEPSSAEFEQMLDELGLKGSRREAMYKLDPGHKRYLLQQNHDFRSNASTSKISSKANGHPASQPTYLATYAPSGTTSILPLVPQLTGGSGFIKRFSIGGWGGAATPVMDGIMKHSSGEFNASSGSLSGEAEAQLEMVSETIRPLQPQDTGGLWSSWWTSSGGNATVDKGLNKDISNSAKAYVDGIRGGKVTDSKLVKHLISLRVHLSTAKLDWIEGFLTEAGGMDALGALLAGLVGKGGKRKKLTDIEITVLLEVIKCLRVLLNTEPGFDQVLSSSTIVTHIAYSLCTPSIRLRTLVLELLAAISILSVVQGHKTVLAAMSDYRVAYEESFRFESLIASLRLPENEVDGASEDESGFRNEDRGVWDARTAALALVNALTNCPESLEERILLRDEFGRRGLNEIIVALRYIKPPDSLLTQLEVYTEEKLEDEEDMQERARNLMIGTSEHHRALSDSEIALGDLIQLARQHGEIYPMMVEILKRYELLLQRDVGIQMKADLLTILDRFVEQAALLNDFDDSWHLFMKRFASSVQHITGQELEVKAASDRDSMTVVEQEMDALRTQVDELSEERTELRNALNQQIAEMNTYKSLPLNLPFSQPKASDKGGNENFHGLVQRLVQKEKLVLQLQAKLDKQNPAEGRDTDERAKRDRDRAKWNTLMDEIAKLKTKNGELEVSLGIKEKEIIYLKRALESVYSRFQSREEDREADFDAQLIASRTIERLTQTDNEISALVSEITDLKAQLVAKPKFLTEQDFKVHTAPPPPPSMKPRGPISLSVSSTENPDSPSRKFAASSPATIAFAIPLPASPPLALGQGNDTFNMSPPLPSPPPPPPPPPPLPLMNGSSDLPPPPAPPPPGSIGFSPPPPPPPPPPSAFQMGSRPKISRPAKRLKPFFWNKVSNADVSLTVWNDIPSDITFNMEDLEATFAIDNAPPVSPRLKMSPTKTQTVTTLLDISRANNIAIMLSRIKLGYPEIRRSLLDIDDQALSIDDLIAISKQLPTSDEIERIRDFEDVGKLSKADQYFNQIMAIPRLSGRLESMIYRRKLDLEIEEIRPELNILRNASREVRSSSKFKQVLRAVLAVGNALNGSSFRGGARGFQLEALLKMKETKTAKGGQECPTLLHYLARILLRADPSLVTFVNDLPHLEAAARVSVQIIMQSINCLVAGLQQINDEIQQLQQFRPLPKEDQFINVMQPFTAQISGSVETLKKMWTSIESELRSLLAYYGERPESSDGCKPEDFFGLILSFSSALQKSAIEIHDAEDRTQASTPLSSVKVPGEAASKTGNQETVAQSLIPPAVNSQGRVGGRRTVNRGDFDEAIRSIRDGKRRVRPNRPLSKIFLDGGGRPQSRIFD